MPDPRCSQKQDGEEEILNSSAAGWGLVPARLGVGMLPPPLALPALPTIPMQAAELSRAEPGAAREGGKEEGSSRSDRDYSLGNPVMFMRW